MAEELVGCWTAQRWCLPCEGVQNSPGGAAAMGPLQIIGMLHSTGETQALQSATRHSRQQQQRRGRGLAACGVVPPPLGGSGHRAVTEVLSSACVSPVEVRWLRSAGMGAQKPLRLATSEARLWLAGRARAATPAQAVAHDCIATSGRSSGCKMQEGRRKDSGDSELRALPLGRAGLCNNTRVR